MNVRRAAEADRFALASFAAALQRHPEHHIAYLGVEPDVIAEEMLEDVDDWTEAAVFVDDGAGLAGWLMGSIDHEMRRVWWFGPFVDRDDPAEWRRLADELDQAARALLGDHVVEEEYAFDARHVVGQAWAVDHGATVDPGSAVLSLEHPLDPPTLPTRTVTPGDATTVGRLHDELFPGTHTTGQALVAPAEPNRIRLVAERDGELLGYVAVERQPDGSGYIDYLGVDPVHRRRGIGGELVRAGVIALADIGCERFHLTVREDNAGARSVYVGLGFVEERVIRPVRRGFSIR